MGVDAPFSGSVGFGFFVSGSDVPFCVMAWCDGDFDLDLFLDSADGEVMIYIIALSIFDCYARVIDSQESSADVSRLSPWSMSIQGVFVVTE